VGTAVAAEGGMSRSAGEGAERGAAGGGVAAADDKCEERWEADNFFIALHAAMRSGRIFQSGGGGALASASGAGAGEGGREGKTGTGVGCVAEWEGVDEFQVDVEVDGLGEPGGDEGAAAIYAGGGGGGRGSRSEERNEWGALQFHWLFCGVFLYGGLGHALMGGEYGRGGRVWEGLADQQRERLIEREKVSRCASCLFKTLASLGLY
jgi:hypothetical protein